MKFIEAAEKIIRLREEDLSLRDDLIKNRKLGNGYDKDMETLHIKNAQRLSEIIDKIGYPTIENVGKEASEAAWLIIQHAISQPAFMKKCADLLAQAVIEQQANPKNLAYLTDRIAVFEDRPQLYGTSFDWDDTGVLNPKPYDDLKKVNERRQSIGLNTLEAQTLVVRKQAEIEHQRPPQNLEKRKKKRIQHLEKKSGVDTDLDPTI